MLLCIHFSECIFHRHFLRIPLHSNKHQGISSNEYRMEDPRKGFDTADHSRQTLHSLDNQLRTQSNQNNRRICFTLHQYLLICVKFPGHHSPIAWALTWLWTTHNRNIMLTPIIFIVSFVLFMNIQAVHVTTTTYKSKLRAGNDSVWNNKQHWITLIERRSEHVYLITSSVND